MNGDEDSGREQSRSTTRRGHHEHDPAPPDDNDPTPGDKRAGDSGFGHREGSLSETYSGVAELDETLDAEIIGGSDARMITAITQWSGDLPRPEDLAEYESILPGIADRLVAINERRMGAIERELGISEAREQTVREAVLGEVAVNTTLAEADRAALNQGQWLSWSISALCLVAVFVGLALGYPQALWALGVPVVQAGTVLVRTVTQSHSQNQSDTQSGTELER